MVKETYNKLAQKYSLPDYNTVNNELEIGSLESDEFLLRKIRKMVVEKLDHSTEVLGSILQPNADSLRSMHECRFFEDNEKQKIIDIYKQIMVMHRQADLLDLELEEKKEADFINDFFSKWADFKKQMIPFISKLKKCWTEETSIEEKYEYLG